MTYAFSYSTPDTPEPILFYRHSVMDLAAQRRWFKRRYPDWTLHDVGPSREHALLEVLRDKPRAYQRLCDKARWERMTLLAVLRDYGDPRDWGKRPMDTAR